MDSQGVKGTISKKKDIHFDHLHLTLSFNSSTYSANFSVSLNICLNRFDF